MTFDQVTTVYLCGYAVVSFGGIAWLMFRHRGHLNHTVIQRTIFEGKKLEIPAEAQKRIDRDSKILKRVGITLFIGWVLLVAFGSALSRKL